MEESECFMQTRVFVSSKVSMLYFPALSQQSNSAEHYPRQSYHRGLPRY